MGICHFLYKSGVREKGEEEWRGEQGLQLRSEVFLVSSQATRGIMFACGFIAPFNRRWIYEVDKKQHYRQL